MKYLVLIVGLLISSSFSGTCNITGVIKKIYMDKWNVNVKIGSKYRKLGSVDDSDINLKLSMALTSKTTNVPVNFYFNDDRVDASWCAEVEKYSPIPYRITLEEN